MTIHEAKQDPAEKWPSLVLEGDLIGESTLENIQRDIQKEKKTFNGKAYGLRKGLRIIHEIKMAYRVGRAHWQEFRSTESCSTELLSKYMQHFLDEVCGFFDIEVDTPFLRADNRRIPVLLTDNQKFWRDKEDPSSPSPAQMLSDELMKEEKSLWGIVTNGHKLCLMRDGVSYDHRSYLEFDLEKMFTTQDVASFSCMWCLIHRTSFSQISGDPLTSRLESWRLKGALGSDRVREQLTSQLCQALCILGSGFLKNSSVSKVVTEKSSLDGFFSELLCLVYRVILIMTLEEKGYIHPDDTPKSARELYAGGYSLAALRTHSIHQSSQNHHLDRWEGLKVLFEALGHGGEAESHLGLRALGGLFDSSWMPLLSKASCENHAFMRAIHKLAWFDGGAGVMPISWEKFMTRDLGSAFEQVLHFTPQIRKDGTFHLEGGLSKEEGFLSIPFDLVEALAASTIDPLMDRWESEDPQAIMENLAILDPACGSGTFLLAAARRITHRLYEIRVKNAAKENGGSEGCEKSEESEDNEQGIRKAAMKQQIFREVTTRCLYGVDISSKATALTKFMLWLHTMDKGKPLAFLDTKIRTGNSLYGVFDLSALIRGIPDGAYEVLMGDKRKQAIKLQRKNKEDQTKSQLRHDELEARLDSLVASFKKELEFASKLPENTATEIRDKAALTRKMRASGTYALMKQTCDAYVASWVLMKNEKNLVPTSAFVWDVLGEKIRPSKKMEIISAELRAFHWPLEFPQVMWRGGFDGLLTSPPGHGAQMIDQLFFRSTHPEVALANNPEGFKNLLAKIESKDPAHYRRYLKEKFLSDRQVHWFRTSGRYPLCSQQPNFGELFADFMRQVVHSRGFAGAVVPTKVMTSSSSAFARQVLFAKRLVSFFGFEAAVPLFLNSKDPFGLLTISGDQIHCKKSAVASGLQEAGEIDSDEKCYQLSEDIVRMVSPNTLSFPLYRSAWDAEVAVRLYSENAPLIDEAGDDPINYWKLKIVKEPAKNLIKATADTHTIAQLSSLIPLYEPDRIGPYDHHYEHGEIDRELKLPAYYVKGNRHPKGDGESGGGKGMSDVSLTSQTTSVFSRVLATTALSKLGGSSGGGDRLWSFFIRTSGTPTRRLAGTIVPEAVYGAGVMQITSQVDHFSFLALSSLLSSLVCEWFVKQKTEGSISPPILKELPMIPPQALSRSRSVSWLGGQSPIPWLAKQAFWLYYTHKDLNVMAEDIGYTKGPMTWDPFKRAVVSGALEAAIFRLYRISKSEATMMMDSLETLASFERMVYGEYRTRRLMLEAWDSPAVVSAECIASTGEVGQAKKAS